MMITDDDLTPEDVENGLLMDRLDYCARGRRFAALAADELEEAYVRTIKAMAD